MRLATVERVGGHTSAAIESDGRFRGLPFSSVEELLRSGRPRLFESAANEIIDDVVDVRPPILSPGKVICVGLNYRAHILEMGRSIPEYPTLFLKFADTLIGPTDDIIVSAVSPRVDWEGELAVVVGAELYRANEEAAEAAIAGYTVANDISLRDWQNRTTQWQQGKMFDATTPVGPVMVTTDEFDPRDGALLRTTVNGSVMQEAPVSDLVFDAPRLLSYISHITRLRPGDVILTGTPGGVGAGRSPELFLADGDIVGVEIDGIGLTSNRVVLTPR